MVITLHNPHLLINVLISFQFMTANVEAFDIKDAVLSTFLVQKMECCVMFKVTCYIHTI